MLRTLVPRAFASLRFTAGWVDRLAIPPGELLDFATLEDRILFNASPVGASVDGAAASGEGAGGDAGGEWIVVEDYSGATTDVHDPLAGGWDIVNGKYVATPASDAISTLKLNGPMGENLELEVSFNANGASGSHLSNAFVIFDYQSATDFKFAGAYVGVDQWVIGHRTASDWVTDTYQVAPINTLTDYQLTLTVAGNSQVTLHANGNPVITHTFADSVTDGQIGLGTKNAVSRFDDLRLRFLPSDTAGAAGELPLFEDFNDAAAEHFSPTEGNWQLVDGQYQVTPVLGQTGASVLVLSEGVPDDVEISVNFNADPIIPDRFTNGVIIFDYHNETDFKYAGGFINRGEWVIGQRTDAGWVDDVVTAATLSPLTDYDMRIVIEDGNTVTLFTADTLLASHTFSESVTDGSIGLGTENSITRFDNFGVTDLSPLELPVSNLFAEMDGRDLVLSGHAAGELLVQAQSSHSFNVYDDGELLYEFSTVKGDLRFELGEWNDHVTLDLNGHTYWKNVITDLGEGDDYFAVVNGSIGKNLRILAGDGMDEVVIADHVSIGKNAVVDLGDGPNQFTAANSKIGGHLKVTGGAESDAVTVDDVKIGGTLRTNLGDGDNDVRIADAKVGGHLKVFGGVDQDHVSLEDVHVRRDAVVKLGDGWNDLAVSGAWVGGRVHVAGGSDHDQVVVEDLRTCGKFVANLGDGDNDFSLADAKVGGDLKVRTGDGADNVSIAKDVTIHRNVHISTGASDDVIDFAGKARWSLAVHAGDGADTLLVSGSVCGCSYVHMGAGDDRVEVAKGGSLGHYAHVKLGAGDDYFSATKGKHCWVVNGGRGDDTIEWLGKSHRHHRGWWWC